MSSLSRELVFLILQFLDEEKFRGTVHKLEQESGFFFNMKYFEDLVQAGEWDEVERYLSGFTKVNDNRYSMKIFFEIRKQKYLEALDKQDRATAVEILVKDLKVFSSFNEDLYKEITQLLTLDNFRQNEQLAKYGDTTSARNIMLMEVKKLIDANPQFREKLAFPPLKASRLRTLINQSLNWQHQLCKSPRPNPDIKTLFVDHTCSPPSGPRTPTPTNNSIVGAIPKGSPFPPIGTHSPFQPGAGSSATLGGWMANPNPPLPHAAVAGGTIGLVPPSNAGSLLKRPRTPSTSNTGIEYQFADPEHVIKRSRIGQADEVNYPGTNPTILYSQDDLPKTVVRSFNQGSNVMSMDFHPMQQTILLVGTNIGDIGIWEVGSGERLTQKAFKVWEASHCTVPLQAALAVKDPVSVNRCIWSPDGAWVGVAFSKHIVQTYSYIGNGELKQHLEIDAHTGGVNDIAFSYPNKQLSVITCGDDKTIKVWDMVTGRKLYTFEGHGSPVYCICPHHKENIQFIFSTAIDGKIKAWLYDQMGSRVDYDAPGNWCTTMAYTADGSRLFSCGTSKAGESHLVEWNESEGAIKRTYNGFRKCSSGVVQFDTTRNKFIAAGDEHQIKFWDMDNNNILTAINIDGCLPASPRLRFNKEGNMLAVTTNDNGIKILANADGWRVLLTLENRSFEGMRVPSEIVVPKASIVSPVAALTTTPSLFGAMERLERTPTAISMNGVDSNRMVDIKPRHLDEDTGKVKNWKFAEVSEPNQCRTMRLPDSSSLGKIVRLLYTNSGYGVIALGSTAAHKIWKWQRNEQNLSGKVSTNVMPNIWQPSNGNLMVNDTSDRDSEEIVPCMALSKNDSYVMSASGGKVSLFNMMTFKIMASFRQPPPAATCLAFHFQDNNIIAIGSEDSTIHIYNVQTDQVKSQLKGHQEKITALAFSKSLNVLVSAGADAQLCIWSIDTWEKLKGKSVHPIEGRSTSGYGDTKVQFHNDQVHLLVVQDSQIAIYDASRLERVCHWAPQESMPASISSATYSCDSQLVYVSFYDGTVGVFDADILKPICRITSTAFLPSGGNSANVYPLVIAAHPLEPNQFAIGLSDGGVFVIEPLESEGKWRVSSSENGALSSNPTMSNQGSELPSR